MSSNAHAAVFAIPLLLWSTTSRAEEPAHAKVKLDYVVPATTACPDRDAFASAIATKLGYDAVASEDANDLETLHVVFSGKPRNRMIVDLWLTTEAGATKARRQLVSEVGSCPDLAGTAAFAAAILLDPRLMFPRPNRASTEATTTNGRESLDSNAPGTWPWYEPRSPMPAEASSPPPPPPPWRWNVGALATACTGCSPSIEPGVGLFLGVAKGPFGVDAGGRVGLPISTTTASGRDIRSSLIVGEIFPHARIGGFRVGVLGSAGSLLGESGSLQLSSVWASVGLRGAFDLSLTGPLFLRIALDAMLTLGRISLHADGAELWSSPIVAAAAHGGMGLAF